MLPNPPKAPRGATLMESVIAIGVLAAAVPMVLAGMLEAGRGSEASGAETRAPWIARTSIEEWRAATAGDTAAPLSLAFSRSGTLVGVIGAGQHADGLRQLDGTDVRYIATVHPPETTSGQESSSSGTLRVAVEYPANAPAASRRTLDFHTRRR